MHGITFHFNFLLPKNKQIKVVPRILVFSHIKYIATYLAVDYTKHSFIKLHFYPAHSNINTGIQKQTNPVKVLAGSYIVKLDWNILVCVKVSIVTPVNV